MPALIGWIDENTWNSTSATGIPRVKMLLIFHCELLTIDRRYLHVRAYERKLLLTFKVQCHSQRTEFEWNFISKMISYIYFNLSEICSSQWDIIWKWEMVHQICTKCVIMTAYFDRNYPEKRSTYITCCKVHKYRNKWTFYRGYRATNFATPVTV